MGMLPYRVVCVVVGMVGAVAVVESVVAQTTPTTTVSTTPITTWTPATIVPVEKINYTLELENDGPVVLDAEITFTARLRYPDGETVHSKQFLYEWNNNADKVFMSGKGDLEYNYIRRFTSLVVEPGTWVMTAAVYSGTRHGEIVDFGSMKFVLTDALNGFLRAHQPLEYQVDNNIFSTEKKIELQLNHTDKFFTKNPEKQPIFQFFWYKDGELIRSTDKPYTNITVDVEGNFTIQTEMYAFFNEVEEGQPSLEVNSSASCNGNSLRSFNTELVRKKMERAVADKCGIITHRLTVKSALKSVDILGQRSVVLGQYIDVNVTCKGSYPTSVCWNVTALNSSEPSLNATCPPNEFSSTCNHRVRIKLTELGWKTVWFTVYNDVSYLSTPFNVYAYESNSVNVPALTIPVVFCTLGLLVIIIGAAYLNKLRKKPVIEVADFDFHPSVSTDNSTNVISKLVNKIRIALHRNSQRGNRRSTDFHETTAKQYGATSLHETL